MKNLNKELEVILNYNFKDTNLLKQSLIHKSFDNQNNNEKLEFLGDRVLGLIISKKLIEIYPNESEGIIDKKFSNLVNKKICSKKEFHDNRYEEKTDADFRNIKELAEKECNNTEFELSPHQMFVRNFLSFQTPYNSLLLFHGLGTGKTCSSISVCEDMRTYYKQIGNKKKIMIVASPNVQENYVREEQGWNHHC